MTTPLTLYYAPDNASLCVRLALLELGVPFETVLVDRTRQGQSDPDYLALNPNGLIPTLITPEGPVYETAVILLWLAARSDDGFMPAGLTRAQALMWMLWLSNTLHPALRMWFYPEKYIAAEAVPALQRATKARLKEMFVHLETHAGWLDLRRPSALACYLAPMIRWAALYGPEQDWFDLSQYPCIHAFAVWAEARPATRDASLAEGLGDKVFSAPHLPNPPEGSAL